MIDNGEEWKSVRDYVDLHPRVAAALAAGEPVVALESSIIAQGMPYPQNLLTALQVEESIREHGAVPATTAVIDGRLRVGLDRSELEALARHPRPHKVARRDIPFVMAAGGSGGTTVSATVSIAHSCGIHTVVTGGIGGIHRGFERTWDVSADLAALARANVAIVCSGAKAFLDLPATLEYLESLSVPVIGYRTSEFPAFYARESGLPLEYRVEEPEEVARLMHLKWNLGLEGAIVVANPPPAAHALERATIETALAAAHREVTDAGITGKAVTPFVLRRLEEVTGGRSLKANIALVLNNARLGAQIAMCYQQLAARAKASERRPRRPD